MLTLRWTLGIVAALFGGGFVVLGFVAGGFRRSFGASELNPLILALPLAMAALLVLALLMPTNRIILHTAAAAALCLVALCIWQIVSEGALVLWFGLLYLTLWFAFYWKSA